MTHELTFFQQISLQPCHCFIHKCSPSNYIVVTTAKDNYIVVTKAKGSYIVVTKANGSYIVVTKAKGNTRPSGHQQHKYKTLACL